MSQKTTTKQTAKKEEPKQPVSQAESTTVQKPQSEKGVPKSEEVKVEGALKPEAGEPKLRDIKLILDALTATVLDHTRQIAELQEALARKRKAVSNGKIQIKDKQTGKVYPSKNNCYQSLLKAGELKDLVAQGIFGENPEKNTFGWYALVREWPDRFKEVKVE